VELGQVVNLGKVMQIWRTMTAYLPHLAAFIQQNRDIVERMQMRLAQADFPTLQQKAHALKGVSGNLALELLQQCCGELEQAARQKQQSRCHEILQQLESCWPATD